MLIFAQNLSRFPRIGSVVSGTQSLHNVGTGQRDTVKKPQRTQMTAASLKEKRVRDLARMAKQSGVRGWHAMRKDELINALVRRATSAQSLHSSDEPRDIRNSNEGRQTSSTGEKKRRITERNESSVTREKTPPTSSQKNPVTVERGAVIKRIQEVQAQRSREKSLVTQPEPSQKRIAKRNRAVLMVRGPHWLHAFWEVTSHSVQRVKASMGAEWHTAKPVLRVLETSGEKGETPAERICREIEIHGGVKNWFIDVRKPMSCRIEIGYKTPSGDFYKLCRSNRVSGAAVGRGDSLDVHWKDIESDCSKIYSLSGGYSTDSESEELRELFQERLRRPLGPPKVRPTAHGHSDTDVQKKGFQLDVDAELVVFGSTEKGAYLSIQGEPIDVANDGSFHIRIEMPNRRQVIPIHGQSASGLEQQTVVLAVERNTRLMEPVSTSEADETER